MRRRAARPWFHWNASPTATIISWGTPATTLFGSMFSDSELGGGTGIGSSFSGGSGMVQDKQLEAMGTKWYNESDSYSNSNGSAAVPVPDKAGLDWEHQHRCSAMLATFAFNSSFSPQRRRSSKSTNSTQSQARKFNFPRWWSDHWC